MSRMTTDKITEERWRILKDAHDKAKAIEAELRNDLDAEEISVLASSARGRFLMAEALALAVCAMENFPPHRRSASDQTDMKRLLWGLFPSLAAVEMEEALARPALDRLLSADKRRSRARPGRAGQEVGS
jgi:hypothetical protein